MVNKKTDKPPVHWLRRHGFILGLLAAVMAAYVCPQPGAKGGGFHPEFVNNGGIALIMFLQGVTLAVEKLKQSAGNWRLHAIIQSFTFVIFPVVGVLLYFLVPQIWDAEPPGIRQGLLYLCVLPSTISTSVVLTAVAQGNVAGALFNAALSNILGVVVTPLLVHALMQASGQSGAMGPLMLKITLLTLLPFFLGMALRPRLQRRVDARKVWVARISNAVIIFIVYTAFCDSFVEQVWSQRGAGATFWLLLWVILLFAGMSGLIYGTCRLLALNREDLIAAYFCSVKKTLAMGVPLAMLIFGAGSDISQILLPLMFYHPLQIFVNGLLANHWHRHAPAASGH
ncbi:MAG TPA: bile acid:sodium symporter family protein [Verrucomicrobiae bacterium]